MRITILALGSRGDVQPYIHLGKGLKDAGHQVRVATFEAFAPMAATAGLNFSPIHGDAQALLQTAAEGEFLNHKANPFQVMRALQKSYGTLAASLPQDLTGLYDSDLILNQLPAYLYGGDLAEFLGIPWAVVAVIPLARTRTMPLMGAPSPLSRLPGFNLLTYCFGEQMGWQLFRASVNRLRTQTWKLPALPFWGPFDDIYTKKVPFVYGFSEHVVPRPPDWGSHIQQTGWWYPEDPAWQPSPELQRFIESGDPPVFIGFGSMPVRDPAKITALIVEAVRLSGRRAILHAGWAGLGGDLPPEIFPMTYAPYGWLLPRMAAIVHHGGSGTSGFGFASGVPSIVVPFAFDQLYWGARAAEMGVGPKPVPFKQLTSERLADAIHTALEDTDMRRHAADLGIKLRRENGIARAVEIINAVPEKQWKS